MRGRIFHGPTAVADGLLTRAELRSRAWQPVIRGVYADSSVPMSHELRCRAVAAFVLPTGGAIAGRSAATLLGAGLSGPDDPVELLVPETSVPRVAGVIAHTAALSKGDTRTVRGVRVTTPVRTCWDLSQWLPLEEAVVIVDRLLKYELITRSELDSFAATRLESVGPRGVRRFRRIIGLCDGRAESPQESRLRVALVQAGLPQPVAQFEIFDEDGLIARTDLAYPEWRIAMEYDGLWHAGADQLHRDRRRLNRLQAAGWLVIHVTSARLRDDFPAVVRELRGAIESRRRRRS